MGGIFSELLNVAGSTVGDPALGNQIAAKANPAFGPITQTPDEIAQTVLHDAQSALDNPAGVNVAAITPASAQIAQAVLPQTAQRLAAAGYVFPPGSVGEQYVTPSVLSAFGGQNEKLVLLAGGVLLAALLVKEL